MLKNKDFDHPYLAAESTRKLIKIHNIYNYVLFEYFTSQKNSTNGVEKNSNFKVSRFRQSASLLGFLSVESKCF